MYIKRWIASLPPHSRCISGGMASSCSTPQCERPIKSRDLCSSCYCKAYDKGLIPVHEATPKHKHRVFNVDERASTADCTECGRVKVRFAKDKRQSSGRWVCAIAAVSGKAYTRITLKEKLCEVKTSCEICGRADKPLVYDHCHKSTFYRGMLCDGCNLGLGGFRDDVESLHRAIEYLHRTDPSLLPQAEAIRTLDLTHE